MAARTIAVYYPEGTDIIYVLPGASKYAIGVVGGCVAFGKKGEPDDRLLIDTMLSESFGRIYGFTPRQAPGVQMFLQKLEPLPTLKPELVREVIGYEPFVIEVPTAPIRVEAERSEAETSPLSPPPFADAEGEPIHSPSVEA